MKILQKFSISFTAILAFILINAFITNEATASHFRYGHLTYTKNPANPLEVTFTLTDAFRRSSYGAPVVGSIFTESTGATSLIFGDATSTPTLRYVVISIDIANDWLLARALQPGDDTKESITHVYPAGGGPYQAEIFSSARTGVEINNPNQSYRVSTIVDVTNGNNSPISTLPVIVNLVQSPASMFAVPAIDPDAGTTLKYRFATLAEMGGVSQNPPSAGGFPATIDRVTGIVTWNTTGAVLGGLYSCQIIIEDRSSADTNILRTRVAVDFLILINNACPNPNFPTFVAPSPTCGTVFAGAPGTPISFDITASDLDPGNVLLNSTGLPPGATMTPVLPQQGNPVSSQFNWVAVAGVYVVSFTATDSCGAQTICTYSFDIVLPVELSSFTSTVTANDVTLNWSTITETNNSGFNIERASYVNGVLTDWNTLGNVQGNGNSNTVHSYSFTDKNLGAGNYAYRLKQIDFNGNFEYHNLSSDVNIGLPTRFELMQNYPNPFNPSTKISFELPTDGTVKLSVFDNSGKQVQELVNGHKNSGYYSVDFNGSNLASGVYYYKLEFSSGSESVVKIRKMALVK
ncbi:MAG TPA: T9SS type A sorting domain-containing protein [Ignavibacteria bacterium]|nr:T9SS type A sorting domain-containing protein [Ignavibacteria bacterium]HQY51461.1 T9SS type A sorting domain-containing protein [Ignavibacteria bacterium]